jgi:hypothetical protein
MAYRNRYHRYNSNGESPTQGLTPDEWEIGNNILKPIMEDSVWLHECFDSANALLWLVDYFMQMYNATGNEKFDPEVAVPTLEELIIGDPSQ